METQTGRILFNTGKSNTQPTSTSKPQTMANIPASNENNCSCILFLGFVGVVLFASGSYQTS
jgi:hypothetical protein